MAKEVRICVTAVRRKEPDLRKLARVAIQLAIAEQDAKGDRPAVQVQSHEEKAS